MPLPRYTQGDAISGWTVNGTERNLVTELSRTVRVDHDANEITIELKMTDRAGNTSEDKRVVSIDKTAPTISVRYDNNSADSVQYFKEDRTATIVVTEINFDSVLTPITIGGGAPPQSEWAMSGSGTKLDTTWTKTISYAADGDYTFAMTCTDLAGNKDAGVVFESGTVAGDEFTIDKTKPEIQVAYDNNSAVNGNYYAKARVATITVTEHNFDSARVKITGTAEDNGAAAAFPALSAWTESGDRHIATLSYARDAYFTFDIELMDKAGNESDDYGKNEFYVDLTLPVLEFRGLVQNFTAWNTEDITPTVVFTDTNYDRGGINLELTKAQFNAASETVAPDGAYSDVTNGQSADILAHNNNTGRAGDGIYTLRARVVDKAGNEFEDQIVYSINRFGSTWYIEENSGTAELVEAYYTNDAPDVEIHEVNATDVSGQAVSFAHAGNVSTLSKGSDYTVNRQGGEGTWKDYLYQIDAGNFAEEGLFELTVYSEDEAGNTSSNRAPKVDTQNPADKLPVDFVVDKTAPSIVVTGVEEGGRYQEASRIVKIDVQDNLALDSAEVFLNGSDSPAANFTDDDIEAAGGLAEYTLVANDDVQRLSVAARDKAGNVSDFVEVDDIFINPSPLAHYLKNTPAVVATVVGAVVAAAAIVFFVVWRRRRKADAA
jgi:hypothetical protein